MAAYRRRVLDVHDRTAALEQRTQTRRVAEAGRIERVLEAACRARRQWPHLPPFKLTCHLVMLIMRLLRQPATTAAAAAAAGRACRAQRRALCRHLCRSLRRTDSGALRRSLPPSAMQQQRIDPHRLLPVELAPAMEARTDVAHVQVRSASARSLGEVQSAAEPRDRSCAASSRGLSGEQRAGVASRGLETSGEQRVSKGEVAEGEGLRVMRSGGVKDDAMQPLAEGGRAKDTASR